ncbi:DUF167 domain-containing protein [Planctomycetota bacterium]
MSEFEIEESDGGVVLAVKVVPGSSRTAVAGLLGGRMKVKIASAPEGGKANRELVGFLAKELGVKKNCISIASGLTKPVKKVTISGISTEALLKKLKLNR